MTGGTGMQVSGLRALWGFIVARGKLASLLLNSGQGIGGRYQWAGEGKGKVSRED